ncbi:hypothetical protein C0993_007876 [Termitomyces sp. T159_Od127]|nr:hypothetical protein C0993_007876 [Termitomyces sp. T159_Od127]
MGANAMTQNSEQHHRFQEGIDDLQRYIKEVLDGKTVYEGNLLIQKLDSFAEELVEHLHDELPTIESTKMRAAFTVQDLMKIKAALGKRVLKEVSLTTVLPLGLVLHDKSTAPEFPPLPRLVVWVVRYGLWYLHSDAWEFGPCDAYGKLKPGFVQ